MSGDSLGGVWRFFREKLSYQHIIEYMNTCIHVQLSIQRVLTIDLQFHILIYFTVFQVINHNYLLTRARVPDLEVLLNTSFLKNIVEENGTL